QRRSVDAGVGTDAAADMQFADTASGRRKYYRTVFQFKNAAPARKRRSQRGIINTLHRRRDVVLTDRDNDRPIIFSGKANVQVREGAAYRFVDDNHARLKTACCGVVG